MLFSSGALVATMFLASHSTFVPVSPDGQVAQQDRLGQRSGVVREVRHRRLATLDRVDPFLEVTGRLLVLQVLRHFDADGEHLVAVVALAEQGTLFADEERNR